MTRAPQTLAVVDRGRATVSVSLLARLGGRWRILGGIAGPAGTPEDALLAVVAARAAAADPALVAEADPDLARLDPAALADLPRLRAVSRDPAGLLVLAASERAAGEIVAQALPTPWRVRPATTEDHDPREMTELALARDVGALLIGAGDPAGPDERAKLDDLAALGGAVARRRPELRVLLAGSVRGRSAWTEALGEDPPGDPGRIRDVPAARRGGTAIRDALVELAAEPADGRLHLADAAASIADLLDRRVEVVEVGFDGGARVVAGPGAAGGPPTAEAVVSAVGALVPAELDDDVVDSVLAWTTGSLDRHRMADRLRDLRGRPWVDVAGDGARLRLAAAAAALARLDALTPGLSGRAAPDITIVAGGGFAVAPPAAIALAVADTIRRPGASQLAWDAARLLGPIGTIEDPAERRALLADVLRDVLVPLGSVLIGAGLGAVRPGGRPSHAGRVAVTAGGSTTERPLGVGELAFIELGPGVAAEARLEFPDSLRFGRRTRHVRVPVSGGLAGLIVDLRDVPLRLPERRDRRRTALAEWSALAWPVEQP